MQYVTTLGNPVKKVWDAYMRARQSVLNTFYFDLSPFKCHTKKCINIICIASFNVKIAMECYVKDIFLDFSNSFYVKNYAKFRPVKTHTVFEWKLP